jgi:predicted nucleic acid-binding protein
MPDPGVVYLDSSALVKLVVAERESQALRRFLRGHGRRATCGLARAEVPRAVRNAGVPVLRRARQVLAQVHVIAVDDSLLDAAAVLEPRIMRSLDAIHLAAASRLGSELEAVVSYDRRMAEAAELLGMVVRSPR